MNHLEFAAAESASNAPTTWEHWITRAELLAGHNLDGDQATDGYSYDSAYNAYRNGCASSWYVSTFA